MMKMNKKNTIIFDMDGVIFDSEATYMQELFKNIVLTYSKCVN